MKMPRQNSKLKEFENISACYTNRVHGWSLFLRLRIVVVVVDVAFLTSGSLIPLSFRVGVGV